MCVRINYIHQEINNGNVCLKWVDTHGNVADVLTKPLSRTSFEQHSNKLIEGHSNKEIEIVSPNNLRNKKRAVKNTQSNMDNVKKTKIKIK